MSGGQFTIPVVFRGPGGAAHQLAAQHSHALESFYAHVPGLKVVMPSTPADAEGLLKSAIRDDNPTIFIESEVMYGLTGEVPDGELTIPLGLADVKREGRDVTVVAWSKMVHVALEAATALAAQGVSVEIIDLRSIRPLDMETVLASVQKTTRCLVVEEGWPFAGVGAQIAFEVSRDAFDCLDAPVERVTSEDVPMPYSRNLERLVIPTGERVAVALARLLGLEPLEIAGHPAATRRTVGTGR